MNVPPPGIEWRFSTRPETWDVASLSDNPDPAVRRSTWLNQTHGNAVVVVNAPGEHQGARADAAVTCYPGAVLAIRTADCAPVLLVGYNESAKPCLVGVVHAGWKGLANNVLGAAAAALHDLGATSIDAWLGPCIGPECYEFGESDLQQLVGVLDTSICGRTSQGTPALDMISGVAVSLDRAGINNQGLLPGWTCTACDPLRYSHRARADRERMALIVSLQGQQP
jgi:polyphenol oxidase